MANFFLYHAPETRPTGEALGTWLREHGLDIAFGTEPGDRRYQGVIRWGATGALQKKPGKVINPGTAIRTVTNKLQFLLDMAEAGIRVPRVWTPNSPGITTPCLGRSRNHTGGTDVIRCVQMSDIRYAGEHGAEYFVEYIPKSIEYRIHVWDDNKIKMSQKVRTNHDVPYDPFVWNLASGFTFRVPEERVPATTRFLAVQAVELAGLDFGAVDIIVSDEGRPYVLEVNTAPGLTVDSSLEAYGNKILEEFNV